MATESQGHNYEPPINTTEMVLCLISSLLDHLNNPIDYLHDVATTPGVEIYL